MHAVRTRIFSAGLIALLGACAADGASEPPPSTSSSASTLAGRGAAGAGVTAGFGAKIGAAGTGLPSSGPIAGSSPSNTLPPINNRPPVAGAPAVPPVNTTAPPPGMTVTPPPKGAAGAPAMAMTPPPVMTTSDPVIPQIMGDCPSLETGSINYMGLMGNVESGPMPASPTAPMLLYWHGTGSTAGEYAFMAADVANGIKQQGGVLVSFENTTNKGDCTISGTAIFCTGDFDVMDQYVACAVKNRNVDPHRIYTAGCSAGGLTATAMAVQRSQYIAAATPNSGGLVFPGQFSSMHTPALMTIHGAPGMDVVGIDFSQSSGTADMAFKQHGGFAVDCNTGGGHCGGGGLAGDAWKFMQAHPFGVSPEPYASGLPMGFSSQCMIPK